MESWGGGEQVLLDLALTKKEFKIIITSPPGNASKIFKKNLIEVYELRSLKKLFKTATHWSLLNKFKILMGILTSLPKLYRIIKSEKIDLILANGNFAGLYTFPLSKLTNIKFIIIQHFIYDKLSVETKITAYLARFAERLVCVSQTVANKTKTFVKNNLFEKIIVIHNGVQIPALMIGKKYTANDVINIGIVGSILRLKGIDQILEALIPIIKDRKDVMISIIGSTSVDPDSVIYFNELKNYIKSHNVDEKIKFPGNIKTKSEIYSPLNIVINYSRIPEAFSLTTAEAMSFGKIVIAANLGGPMELIDNKKNGFLCDPNKPEELKKIVEYCINNLHTEQLQQIRLNARLKIETTFSLDVFRTKYIGLFQEVI
ncbi:MAG: glycosyltransferase family 4 protein [Ignavibacteriaceae bacterium]